MTTQFVVALVLGALCVFFRWDTARIRRRRMLTGQHVNYVVMDEEITHLDADVSQFTTLLMKVSTAQAEGASIQWTDPRVWDDWAWTSEWEQQRAAAVEHFEAQMRPETKINRMEDELFPRLKNYGRVIQTGDPKLRLGDIVRRV